MPKRIDWNPIRADYISGMSEAAICTKYDVHYNTLLRFITRENLRPLRKNISLALAEKDVGLVNMAPADLTPSQLVHTKNVWMRRQIAVLDMQLALLEKELSAMNGSNDLPALNELAASIAMLSQINHLYRKLYDVEYNKQTRGASSGYSERATSGTITEYDEESKRIMKIEEMAAKRVTTYEQPETAEVIDVEAEVIDG